MYSFDNGVNTSCSFCGLTSIISRKISDAPDYVKKISEIYPNSNGRIGNLPKDMFELFSSGTKEDNAVQINRVKDAFKEANEILSEIERLKIDACKDMKPNNLVNAFLPKLSKLYVQPERIPRIITEMRKRLTPSKDILAQYSQKASEILEKRFKEIGLLSDSDKVELSYIAQGKYKNAFKMRLINNEGQDIIHPKTILSFKSSDDAMEQIHGVLGLIKKYFQNIKQQDYIKVITNLLDHASEKVIPSSEKATYKKALLDLYSKFKSTNEEDRFIKLISDTMYDEIKYNGVGPESNITQFIKHSAGHPLKASNYIDVFYIDTKNNVGLSEFSDKSLGEITKEINLHKYGMYHSDLRTNKDNMVEGRVIDYGGIKRLKGFEELCKNRVARRYYHKISQIKFVDEEMTNLERVKYWNNLYKKAVNGKIPNHNDVLIGLKKGKMLISPQYWDLLSDI